MFTLHQIQQASEKSKTGADFPQFIQDLKVIGVSHYDTYVSDGHTTYYGAEKFSLNSDSKYQKLNVNDISSAEKLKHTISIHQKGQTDYPTFCTEAADVGVEKWSSDLTEMTVTYLDKKGTVLTVEPIPQP